MSFLSRMEYLKYINETNTQFLKNTEKRKIGSIDCPDIESIFSSSKKPSKIQETFNSFDEAKLLQLFKLIHKDTDFIVKKYPNQNSNKITEWYEEVHALIKREQNKNLNDHFKIINIITPTFLGPLKTDDSNETLTFFFYGIINKQLALVEFLQGNEILKASFRFELFGKNKLNELDGTWIDITKYNLNSFMKYVAKELSVND